MSKIIDALPVVASPTIEDGNNSLTISQTGAQLASPHDLSCVIPATSGFGGNPAIGSQVVLFGGPVTITQSGEQLFRVIGPKNEIFWKGGVVFELVNEDNRLVMNKVEPAAAQSRFEKHVRFVKGRKAVKQVVYEPVTITESAAKAYLNSEACKTYLPKLNDILTCPLLIEQPNGQLRQLMTGYDRVTGYYLDQSEEIDSTMPLDMSVSFLTSFINDFDFVTQGDRSRAIASLLTPALKLGGFIRGSVPVDVAEANASQSGKTYRQKMVAALYNQTLAVVNQRKGGVGSLEETFADHLLKGRPFIQFDNIRGSLDSPYLESFLTAGQSFACRIPYHGIINIDPSKFFIFISSNGFETTRDLANRSSIPLIIQNTLQRQSLKKCVNIQYSRRIAMRILHLRLFLELCIFPHLLV